MGFVIIEYSWKMRKKTKLKNGLVNKIHINNQKRKMPHDRKITEKVNLIVI